MGQRCVHYIERDNGTRVLYAPNQCEKVDKEKDFGLFCICNSTEYFIIIREQPVHPAVAGDVFDGVLFCAVIFPTRCLGRDLKLN